MSAPSLAVSAGHGVDVAFLNAFWTAALRRVVREAVLVRAPASAYVVASAGVRDVPPVLLVVSMNLLQFAVNVSSSARLAGALLRREPFHARS